MSEQSIYDKSLVIRNETQEYANTRGRVADVLDDINLTKANKTDVDNAIQIILDELGLTEAELYSYIDAQNQLQDIEIGKKVDKPVEVVGEIKYILSNVDGVISWKPIEVTENFIPKFKDDTFQNSSLFQDENGNIGIGTVTPENKLHVTGYIQAEAYMYESTTENSIPNKSFTDGVDLFFTDENGITRKHLFTDSTPDTTQHGPITTTSNSVTIGLSPLGENFAMIAGVKYIEPTTNPETPKPFTAVSPGMLKVVIIQALTDATVFHLVEGAEGVEAVEPLYSGLFVARLIISATGVVVEAEESGNKYIADDAWRQFTLGATPLIISTGIYKSSSFEFLTTEAAPVFGGIITKKTKNVWDGKRFYLKNSSDNPVALNPTSIPVVGDANAFTFDKAYVMKPKSDAVIWIKNGALEMMAIGGGASFPEVGNDDDVLVKSGTNALWSSIIKGVEFLGNAWLKLKLISFQGYTIVQKNAIVSPQEGMLIYQNENPKGFQKYENGAWFQVGSNISNSDLSNVSARIFTQGNTFTWNTAGFLYYLKGLSDKSTNVDYSKKLVINPVNGAIGYADRGTEDRIVLAGSVGSTYECDLLLGNVFNIQMFSNTTYSFANTPDTNKSVVITLRIIGAGTPTFPAWLKPLTNSFPYLKDNLFYSMVYIEIMNIAGTLYGVYSISNDKYTL